MSAAQTDKIILFFCEYKNHNKENNSTIICDSAFVFLISKFITFYF